MVILSKEGVVRNDVINIDKKRNSDTLIKISNGLNELIRRSSILQFEQEVFDILPFLNE